MYENGYIEYLLPESFEIVIIGIFVVHNRTFPFPFTAFFCLVVVFLPPQNMSVNEIVRFLVRSTPWFLVFGAPPQIVVGKFCC